MESADAGVLTSDPRIVREAQPVPLLTFDEATELAFFGATVLHPSAMQPAMQHSSLDVRVKNSYNRYQLSPSNMGTLVCFAGSALPGKLCVASMQSTSAPSEPCSSIALDKASKVAAGKQQGHSSPEKET